MSVEDNLRVIDNMVKAYNTRDWNLVMKLHSKSVIGVSPDSPEPRKGREAIRQEFVGFATAFPDSHLVTIRAFGQQDWVSAEFAFKGTHKGPLPGPGGQSIPATNRPLQMEYAVVYKLKDGEITERHEYFDLLGMMAQLGIKP